MATEDLPRQAHNHEDITEEHSFDALARGLASGMSRRRVLKLLGGSLAGGLLAFLGVGAAAAQEEEDCKRNGKPCKKNSQCCSGNCVLDSGSSRALNGTCAAACVSNGGSCTGGSQCCSGNCKVDTCVASCIPPGASSCDPRDPGSCGAGCACIPEEASGGGICGVITAGIPCTTSCGCPTGQFCGQFGTAGVCTVAC